MLMYEHALSAVNLLHPSDKTECSLVNKHTGTLHAGIAKMIDRGLHQILVGDVNLDTKLDFLVYVCIIQYVKRSLLDIKIQFL